MRLDQFGTASWDLSKRSSVVGKFLRDIFSHSGVWKCISGNLEWQISKFFPAAPTWGSLLQILNLANHYHKFSNFYLPNVGMSVTIFLIIFFIVFINYCFIIGCLVISYVFIVIFLTQLILNLLIIIIKGRLLAWMT